MSVFSEDINIGNKTNIMGGVDTEIHKENLDFLEALMTMDNKDAKELVSGYSKDVVMYEDDEHKTRRDVMQEALGNKTQNVFIPKIKAEPTFDLTDMEMPVMDLGGFMEGFFKTPKEVEVRTKESMMDLSSVRTKGITDAEALTAFIRAYGVRMVNVSTIAEWEELSKWIEEEVKKISADVFDYAISIRLMLTLGIVIENVFKTYGMDLTAINKNRVAYQAVNTAEGFKNCMSKSTKMWVAEINKELKKYNSELMPLAEFTDKYKEAYKMFVLTILK